MIELKTLSKYLDELLEIDKIPDDSSNNGLQVEGNHKVSKIVFGVDACLAISEIASKENADFIFVHHGLSWKDGFKRLTGHSAKIFSILFKNDVSLYGAHLPLDAHIELGHNAQIAKLLKLDDCRQFAEYSGTLIGTYGELKNPTTLEELTKIIDHKLDAISKVFGNNDNKISKIGIISGGPGSFGVEAAVENGLDCLITGEAYHGMWHLIQDTGINVIAAGHYCTEKPGVEAVMENIQQKFDIECEFIDLPTGL